MQAPVHIRPARPDEAPLLPEVERSAGALFRTTPGLAWVADHAPTPAAFYGPLIAAGGVWVACAVGRDPVGFLSTEQVGDTLHLWELAVRAEAQGRGLGRRLMEAARADAEARGLAALTLTTFTDVAWNAPFYARLGYRVLAPAALGDFLAGQLRDEVERGLPARRRCAMRLDLGPGERR